MGSVILKQAFQNKLNDIYEKLCSYKEQARLLFSAKFAAEVNTTMENKIRFINKILSTTYGYSFKRFGKNYEYYKLFLDPHFVYKDTKLEVTVDKTLLTDDVDLDAMNNLADTLNI